MVKEIGRKKKKAHRKPGKGKWADGTVRAEVETVNRKRKEKWKGNLTRD